MMWKTWKGVNNKYNLLEIVQETNKRVHAQSDIWGVFNNFPDVFVQASKIVVESWKFSMLLLYILWDD